MNVELIKLPTETLLGKFGVGNHIPGSGSAAALQAMLSAQMISTVINLTIGKQNYESVIPQLKSIYSEINTRIYPRLQELFQQDSEQFDCAIKLRKARDDEKKFKKKKELNQGAQVALKWATETLVEIAELSVELGDFSTFIFRNAFKSARGDSGVAINGAASAVASCLSIITLNFLVIDDRSWTEKVKLITEKLKVHYERLLKSANDGLITLEKEVEVNQNLKDKIIHIQSIKSKSELYTNDIENVAKELQNILWKYRNTIWKNKKPQTPREVLRPDIAIEKLFNYKIVRRSSLGIYNIDGNSTQVAGIIDNDNKAIGISTMFSREVQNFTLAHELGHAILHKQTGIHRDKSIGVSNENRAPIEMQADKFATYFLMPEKQIKDFFKSFFFMEKFTLNEDNVFALNGGDLASFRLKCKTLRDLSRTIASAETFYGTPFQSFAEVFNVSIEAMAIRLEELNLVEFESQPSHASTLNFFAS